MIFHKPKARSELVHALPFDCARAEGVRYTIWVCHLIGGLWGQDNGAINSFQLLDELA
jgi:hypothetical protein